MPWESGRTDVAGRQGTLGDHLRKSKHRCTNTANGNPANGAEHESAGRHRSRWSRVETDQTSMIAEGRGIERVHDDLRYRGSEESHDTPRGSQPKASRRDQINRSEANRPDLPRQAHLGEGEAMCLAEMVAEAERVGQVDEGAIQIEDSQDPEVRVHTSFTGSDSPDRSRAPISATIWPWLARKELASAAVTLTTTVIGRGAVPSSPRARRARASRNR
jgi:hypothetical protein